MQIDLANADAAINKLIDHWCARRALGPLREILACYPMAMRLTDEWIALANCFKTIRVRFATELPEQEIEQVIALQHLSESIVSREHVA